MTAPTLREWQEWRTLCAIAKCGPATAEALRGFAHMRFRHHVAAVVGDDRVGVEMPSPEVCFALFEHWCSVARPRSGRRYKEWLFARACGMAGADALAAVESGATLLVRSVVRKWLAHSARDARETSLDAPIPGTDGLTLGDLVPDDGAGDPSAKLSRDEAEAIARDVFSGMRRPARLVMLSRLASLPLYHPRLLAEFGVGKSRASQMWRGVIGEIAAAISRRWPGETSSWRLSMAMCATDALYSLLATYDSGAEIRTRLSALARA